MALYNCPQFFAVNFAKFHGPVRKIPWLTTAKYPNSAAYHGLVRKLSFTLFKNSFWMLAVMLATYKGNYRSFFFSKVQFVN